MYGLGHYRDGRPPKVPALATDGPAVPTVTATPTLTPDAAVAEAESRASGDIGMGRGLVEYSGSSDEDETDDVVDEKTGDNDDDDGPPIVAPSNVEPRGPRQVVTPVPSDAVADAAEDGGSQTGPATGSTAEQRLADLEQSLEDPHKRLRAGKFKTTLLERVGSRVSLFFHHVDANSQMTVCV